MEDINKVIKENDNDYQHLLCIIMIIYNIIGSEYGMSYEEFSNWMLEDNITITKALGILAGVSSELALKGEGSSGGTTNTLTCLYARYTNKNLYSDPDYENAPADNEVIEAFESGCYINYNGELYMPIKCEITGDHPILTIMEKDGTTQDFTPVIP